jgi:formylglycine-generating enzyme required for sulfatase activity
MAGNVSEWVRDYYGDTFYRTCPGVCKDPLNTDSVSGYRVIRGGGFLDVDAEHMRVVYRDRREWWNRSIDLGFRCRRTP